MNCKNTMRATLGIKMTLGNEPHDTNGLPTNPTDAHAEYTTWRLDWSIPGGRRCCWAS